MSWARGRHPSSAAVPAAGRTRTPSARIEARVVGVAAPVAELVSFDEDLQGF